MRRVSRQINRSLFTSIVLKFYICCVTFVLSNTMAFICSRGSRSMVNNVASNSGSSRVRVPFRSRTANDVHQLKKHHGGMASHRHHFVWFDNKLTRVIASSILAISVARPASAVISIPNAAAGASTTSYHLSRILFLRLLAVVYLSAFSVARFQNKGLIGDKGITPARKVLDNAEKRGALKSQQRKDWIQQRDRYTTSQSTHNILSRLLNICRTKLSDFHLVTKFRDEFWYKCDGMNRPLPTLLWFAKDRSNLNPWLDGLANTGLFLSTIMLATGSANVPLMFGLWLIQRSLMSVGGVWYGYGWEPQLAELTFHALFLVPLLSMDLFFGWNGVDGPYPVPKLVVFAVRFYLFKIMLGAGLIKVKSRDMKWKPGNMSAMYYFYETQPVPNSFSRYFHSMPERWHKFEVWGNHFVELVAPFMLLTPVRKWRLIGGLVQIVFQTILISSGNLSFLNWLTIVPAILCLDDSFLINNLPHVFQKVAFGTPSTLSFVHFVSSKAAAIRATPITRALVSILFFLLMAKLNTPIVKNLMARRQVMNGSFDKLRLASTYGAFGTVSETRNELIIESSNDIGGPWKEYQFKVKPGDVYRPSPWISPYHHRLDWQMWIASQVGGIERSYWLPNFLLKLLNQEKDVIDLIEGDPWKPESSSSDPTGSDGPKFIRIEKYRYKFYTNNRDFNAGEVNGGHTKPQYWSRERIGRYFPRQGVVNAAMLKEILGRDD